MKRGRILGAVIAGAMVISAPAMIRSQFLDPLHRVVDDKIREETKQESEVQTSGGTLVVPPPRLLA
jgi:hypothetical protein